MSTSPQDPTRWFADLLATQQSALKGLSSTAVFQPASAALPNPWQQAFDMFSSWHRQGLEQMASLWPAGAAAADRSDDRRFAGEGWRKDPRLHAVANAYLAQSELLHKAVDAAPLDARSKAQWGFVLRQVIDALSPANCLASNPEALQTALDTGGASLAEGLRLFVQDLAKGRVSMSDEQAFEVGRDLATSPGGVVFENELMQLIQYATSTAQVGRRPLLIVPPCINKYYILDLQPENSLVAYAVAQGHTVFLLSWRNAGPDQGRLTWDDYLEQGVLQAIDVALAISGADLVNTLGFCIGGTLLASALAVATARGEDKAASMTLLTTMLDFSDTGEIGLLVSEPMVAAREAAIGRGGLLQGRELAQVFAALRANDLIWPYVVAGYLKGKAPAAFDLLFWNSDATNLPGPMFCWYLRNTYLENRLCRPGTTVQCGERVDLSTIEVPAFLYASREDHIVPWQTAYASTRLLGGDVTFVLGASGHIAGVINPPAKNKRNHWLGAVRPDATAWLEHARSEPGSWWPAWSAWLARYAGEARPARKKLGNARYKVLEPAPGRYVREKAG